MSDLPHGVVLPDAPDAEDLMHEVMDLRVQLEAALKRASEAALLMERTEESYENACEERDASLAREAALREALELAHWFSEPEITRGPAVKQWVRMRDLSSRALFQPSEASQAILVRVRREALEEAAKAVLDGRFLHDDAPTAKFAREVAAMLRRLADTQGSIPAPSVTTDAPPQTEMPGRVPVPRPASGPSGQAPRAGVSSPDAPGCFTSAYTPQQCPRCLQYGGHVMTCDGAPGEAWPKCGAEYEWESYHNGDLRDEICQRSRGHQGEHSTVPDRAPATPGAKGKP